MRDLKKDIKDRIREVIKVHSWWDDMRIVAVWIDDLEEVCDEIERLRQEKLKLEAEVKRLDSIAFKRWSEIQKLEAELEEWDE